MSATDAGRSALNATSKVARMFTEDRAPARQTRPRALPVGVLDLDRARHVRACDRHLATQIEELTQQLESYEIYLSRCHAKSARSDAELLRDARDEIARLIQGARRDVDEVLSKIRTLQAERDEATRRHRCDQFSKSTKGQS